MIKILFETIVKDEKIITHDLYCNLHLEYGYLQPDIINMTRISYLAQLLNPYTRNIDETQIIRQQNRQKSILSAIQEKIDLQLDFDIIFTQSTATICGIYFLCNKCLNTNSNIYINHNQLTHNQIFEYANKWEKLVEDNSKLRILKDNEIIGIQEDYFDQDILSMISNQSITHKELYPVFKEHNIPILLANSRIQNFINNNQIEVIENNEIIHYRKIKSHL